MKTKIQTNWPTIPIVLAANLLIACGTAVSHLHAQTPVQIAQQAYLKASNTGVGDSFGTSVAISGDTMVVGAFGEASNATGVNGNQNSNSAESSGAAYVFVRAGSNWVQQAYLKASNAEGFLPGQFVGDFFGTSVAVSGDTIVVGAPGEDSNATGVNGDQNNNNALASGAAYIFVRQGTNWTQQAYLKASNAGADDNFGESVAISGDTILIGALGEDSNATGVNGNQANNSAPDSGAAYVFVREGTNWTQQAYLKASNSGAGDNFGAFSVSISGDTIVVGAQGEASNATGVNGNQANNSEPYAGAAYVFVREGTNWTQQAYLKASNTARDDLFAVVAVSGDTIVVAAVLEASNATGVNGNQANNSAPASGAAYVFVRNGTNWMQQAYLKASNTGADDWFGTGVSLSGDTLVVGAPYEDSNARGVNGNQANNSTSASGATYVFVRKGTNWTQQAYLKASNTEAEEYFGGDNGKGVAVSGGTIVVGAPRENSNATGVNGNQADNSAAQAGAAYIFTIPPPQLRLTATINGNTLQLTASGTTNTQWRLEYRDTVAGTNAWQPLTNITLGLSPTVIHQPLDSTNRFYRAAWMP